MGQKTKSIILGFLSILGGKVGSLIISMLFTPIIVRLLGPDKYGTYAFMLSILAMLTITVNAGVGDGVQKYISERESPQWESGVYKFYLLIGIGLSLTASVLVLVAVYSGLVSQVIGPVFKRYFYTIPFIIISNLFYQLNRYSLMGLGNETYSESLVVIYHLVLTVTAIFLVLAGFDVQGVLVAHILANLSVSVIGFYLIRERIDIVGAKNHPDLPKYDFFTYNIYSIILIVLTVSLYHIDLILLRPLVGGRETGYYKSALVIAEFIWFIPHAVQTVLLHSTSKMWEDNEMAAINELSSKVTRYTVLLTLISIIGVAVLANPFIKLYFGSDFSPAVSPLYILLPGVFGFAVARPIFAIGQGKGDLKPLIYATLPPVILNIVLNIVLIPRCGINGAALATSIGYGSMLLFHVIAAKKIGFEPISDIRIFRIILAGIVAFPVVYFINSLYNSSILSLIVVPLPSFLIFVGICIIVGAIDIEEIQQICRVLRR